jgi:hypothetical protein
MTGKLNNNVHCTHESADVSMHKCAGWSLRIGTMQ